METPRVTVVTIMHGDRWKFLSQVVTAMMKDLHVTKLVIVDNGSKNKEEIESGTREYGERIKVLRQEKNLGSAGGFAKGLEYARDTQCDFVLILDDDSVPEDGAIAQFILLRKLFPDEKVVLSGNRLNLGDNKDFFYQKTLRNVLPSGTFFDILSFKKLTHFFRLLTGRYKKSLRWGPFIPIIPNESFVYGGAFIPIDAVRRAPLPDVSLFLYGDDIEYSWGIKNLGYSSYVCSSPVIHDVDISFSGSHLSGLFDSATAPYRAYYRIRNMIRLSKRHSKQMKIVLFANIIIWIFGLYILGFAKYGFTSTYYKRVILITKAIWGGYHVKYPTPQEAVI